MMQVTKAWWDGQKLMAEPIDPTTIYQEPARQEFFTHNVERPYDWSEWVCPDPQGYLMKCCDCGLVHEAEFGVVRYKSETEREDCEPVEDPNLQAVFRMRRSEQWSPEDTAHRAGGLPMEPPAQQKPVACVQDLDEVKRKHLVYEKGMDWKDPLYTIPPAQPPWVGLTDEELAEIAMQSGAYDEQLLAFARAIEAKLKEKNSAA